LAAAGAHAARLLDEARREVVGRKVLAEHHGTQQLVLHVRLLGAKHPAVLTGVVDRRAHSDGRRLSPPLASLGLRAASHVEACTLRLRVGS